ncbi:MAG TPA: ImmA/IrrE family metallo-endopeptidase [Blastocatellia bacterium]|nr:ImmA/IrrE family metallo-endopeptidase [Blastocatellia bacterium]
MMIRRFAGARLDRPVNPFELAKHVKILVVDIDKIKGLPEHTRRQLLKSDRGSWSAGTTKPLPNGWRLVILNPTHGKERSAATLMEEICHVWLGHTPGKLHSMDENGLRARDYNESDERAAYGVGAAVLVPYSVLRLAVENGVPAEEIAKRYGVSRDLVEFRIKVTHLWDEYKQKVLKTTA